MSDQHFFEIGDDCSREALIAVADRIGIACGICGDRALQEAPAMARIGWVQGTDGWTCRQCHAAQRPRRNVEAQEEVVAALWEFARNNDAPGEKTRCTKGAAAGAAVHLSAVGEALERILAAFGYEVTPID